jgi:hypothetical protein
MGWIHFLPAFKLRGDFELVRIRKSTFVICHFCPPLRFDIITYLKSHGGLVKRCLIAQVKPGRDGDGEQDTG